MQYRKLGKTGLMVSEIGFGGEWLERHEKAHSVALIKHAHSLGVNIIDCWMPDPKSRDIIGEAIAEDRAGWIVQGHIGSTWQHGQYTRTRDADQCRIAFEDLLDMMDTIAGCLEEQGDAAGALAEWRRAKTLIEAMGNDRFGDYGDFDAKIARLAAESN